jgi:hypothetical protein
MTLHCPHLRLLSQLLLLSASISVTLDRSAPMKSGQVYCRWQQQQQQQQGWQQVN